MAEHDRISPWAAALSEAEREELRARIRAMNQARMARRQFLAAGGTVSLAAILAACGGAANTPTQPQPTPNLVAPAPSAAPNVVASAAPSVAPSAAASAAPSAAGAATPAAASARPAASAAPSAASGGTLGKLTIITDPKPKYAGSPAPTTDTLTIIRGEDLTDLNPTALNVYSPFTFVYDPLVWMDEFTLDPLPWLAESWDISADGKTYTYKLRKDVKWHDGSPLTAEDVAFSMILYRDDPESGVARFFPLMKKDPVVVDANTVKFELDSTSGDWVLNASNQFIVQKKQFNEYWSAGKGEKGVKTLKGYDWTKNMLIGTGPFVQKKVDLGSAPNYIEYEANPTYFKGKPYFAKMIFKDVQQSNARIAAWLNNETDLLWPVTAAEADQVKDKEAKLYSAYAVAFMNAWINFTNPKGENPDFLKDKKVRQAMSAGIDRKGYAQAVFRGFVDETKIGSVSLPWAYNTNLKSPDFDTKKAGDMLAEAGYKKDASGNLLDKAGKPVKLVAITNQANQYPVDKIAVSVQEDWKKLGIQLQIDTLEAAALRKRWREEFTYDMFFVSRILFAGFSDYNYYHSAWDVRKNPQGRNFGGWANAAADKLLDEIIREPDLKKQKDLLWKFQEIIADDMPAFWFGFPRDLILVKKEVEGYQPNAMWQYWNTWPLWKTK